AQAFAKAGCSSCHAGALYTNNGFAHVGTNETAGLVGVVDFFAGQNVAAFPNDGVNVPSLLGVARSAPYLHDGSAATLRDRIENGRALDQHGKTSLLSDGEVGDLIEFLKSI